MTVKLATQVLSSSMASVLQEFGEAEAGETAIHCRNLDSFFDCVNVRHPTEGKRNLKPFLEPYTDIHERYFDDWWDSIEKREGDFLHLTKRKCLSCGCPTRD